jgi:aminoglycoside 6-adenylyltransferase
MRSDHELLELIVNTAKSDDRIRTVILNGSRANPNARQDIFQDYDIAYLVTDVDSFKDDPAWINRFGEIMILQEPEAMGDPPPANDGRYVYLMQFTDGHRIDLTLYPVAEFAEYKPESLSVLLLDKDGNIGSFPAPSERDYIPTPPTAKNFFDCCNEFWWVCPYVAKGLWREEIIYARYMLDQVVRAQLMKMLTWHIGVNNQFSCAVGSHGKGLKQQLEPTLWSMLEKTYSDVPYENTWNALYAMCELFRVVAHHVARHFGFDYPSADDDKVSAHLKHVQSLPSNATTMY